MGKAKDDGRKAPIYEADTDKKKQRLDFLKNSEIEPKRIRF